MLNHVLLLSSLAGAMIASDPVIAAVPAHPVEAPANQPRTARTANSVQSLQHDVSAGGTIWIRITFKEALAEPPGVLRTYHPSPSISFDFTAMSSTIGRIDREVNQSGLRSIHLVPANDRARLTLSLTHPHVYETERTGNELRIVLRSSPSASRRDTGPS